MKFFSISLAFLVILVGIVNFSKAQECISDKEFLVKTGDNKPVGQKSQAYWQGGITYPSDKAPTPLPSLEQLKLLKQMEHGRWLCKQFLISVKDASLSDPISMEASLVDLRSQCQSQYDRLIDQHTYALPKKASTFYQTILEKFVPQAEYFVESLWTEQEENSMSCSQESINELLCILEHVEDHFVLYQRKYLHLDRSYASQGIEAR